MNNTSIPSTISTNTAPLDFGTRLYKTKTASNRKEKSADDAILTTLPAETIRWVKSHRKANSTDKVPMSHFREKQLREMFKGLDFQNCNAIDLDELKDAVKFVQERTKNRRGGSILQNIQGMFEAMDDNGDGTVDFQEFCAAMTGSTKSALGSASEYDIEKLHMRFVQYAREKKRRLAIDTIGTHLSTPLSSPMAKHAEAPTNDYPRYKNFRTLFEIGKETTLDDATAQTNLIESRLANKVLPLPGASWLEDVAKSFVDDYLENKQEKGENDAEYRGIFENYRSQRLSYLESLKRDTEARALEERIAEERKFILLGKKEESKWSTCKNVTHRGPFEIVIEKEAKYSIDMNRKANKIGYELLRKKEENYPESSSQQISPSSRLRLQRYSQDQLIPVASSSISMGNRSHDDMDEYSSSATFSEAKSSSIRPETASPSRTSFFPSFDNPVAKKEKNQVSIFTHRSKPEIKTPKNHAWKEITTSNESKSIPKSHSTTYLPCAHGPKQVASFCKNRY